ncbi:transporter substrate-binding domain-containing protein [Variovorax sp. KK3]|uniref:transporter substrate-binding domain-containing protein n=1 Tax=Variovorax sp. KK3 TaxID=1855728 RepID=UPI0009F85DB2|nr:transporter substrate-binding domain-containing protein [Variovorax sp. KK3]
MKRSMFVRAAALAALLGTSLFAQAQSTSTLQTVKSRGTLIAGVRFDSPPYGFVDAAGKNIGFDVEFAEDIAKRLGVKLELVRVTGQSRIPTLTAGKVDMLIAAITKTAEREKVIDFTTTYVTDGSAVVVRKGSPIRTPSDLNGRAVSFVQGTTADAGLKEQAPQAVVTKFQEYPAAFLAFQQGVTEAFIGQALGLDQYIKTDPSKYEVLPKLVIVDPIAIGVRKGDDEWRTALDGQLKAMVADGTWDRIIKKYVSTPVEKPKF